ncbi:spore germination protein GerPC [Cohnella rhizosphaerae]|uniref:Spore germination protein GerPC n=1 Tax=Cohnella rhizosphaerae TaxID=1457232 RepID=A0A9X4KYG0_9BACL|nr:spore germination protein GerPC [Cohnella rhizosphaerae]MDG0813227.1 spore germination protein GerPC [Cohnella rhizosphaerae]
MNAVWYYPSQGQVCDEIAKRLQTLEAQMQAATDRIGSYEQQIATLTQQQTQMQAQIAELQTRVEDLQRKPPVHVEYHFDQLKVSRLDGTLNIGLSPNGQSGVDAFDVPTPGMWQTPAVGQEGPEPQIPGLLSEGAEFMNGEAPANLSALAAQNGLDFQPSELRAVTEDVKAQLGARIQYYARTMPLPEKAGDRELAAWRQSVMDKVKKDILTAFDSYVRRRAAEAAGQRRS